MTQVKAMEQMEEEFNESIQQLEPYVRIDSNGLFYLDVKSNEELELDEMHFTFLKQSIEETNRRIQTGQIKLADVHFSSEDSLLTSEESIFRSCPGRNGVRTYWWGIRLYLNECKTRTLIHLLDIGSGVAEICALVAPACKLP